MLALVYHENYLLHEHTPTHPERRERLMYTMDQLEEEGILDMPDVDVVEPSHASRDDLLRVHEKSYLNKLMDMSAQGRGSLSIDTHISEHTWDQCRLAAGGVKLAGELVVNGEYDSSFVMSRPGGHHAFSNKGHGFCFTNNTAVMIRHIQENTDVEKVLIWDWDAHHFDGTQEIFYDDPSVLAISTHQDGRTLFPGTGFVDETGEGDGEGYTINVPLSPKTGDDGYLKVVDEVFEPVAREFDPDLMFIEAGQDNHFTDPITDLGVTAQGYARLMNKAVETADELCDGDIVASLAGGYGIEGGLPYTNLAVIASLLGLDTSNIREPSLYDPPEESPEVDTVIRKVKDMHSAYWDF
ncbi:MAG: histone deacetylase [Halobacteria archaeon]|nr:histone deacetylase [Halobacteria archaeon]